MPLPPRYHELINPAVRVERSAWRLFDFDGTLSLIREGWPRVMVDLMLDHLRTQRLIREPEPECAARVEAFVMALNGHPTVRQMERFVEEVTARGGTPAAPAVYLQQYIDALMAVVRGRWEALESGRARPEEWVVPNALPASSVRSGRGRSAVRRQRHRLGARLALEVELLRLTPHVGGRVYAAPAKDNDASFRKRDVIERAVCELGVPGAELIGFGDGVVETQEVKRAGGVAVGVASSEAGVRGVHASKRAALIAAGADIIVPDYEHASELLAWLWVDG